MRIGLAQMTWHMVADHPLTGVGFGHFRDQAPRFAQDPSSPYYAFSSTAMEHNNMLSVLAETGFIGLALYLTAIVSLIVISIRLYHKLPTTAPGFINRDLIVLYWILAAAFLIDGFFRETSDNPFANCLFFGLSGVIAALNILLGPKSIRAKVGYPVNLPSGVKKERPAARMPVRITAQR
jgi:O-antigen ligase